LKLDESMGLDQAALQRRLAKGAEVSIEGVDGEEDKKNIEELLESYLSILGAHEHKEEADLVRGLLQEWQSSFVKVVPVKR
jgi:glutamate synthase (NADPH/NADH) large chain